MSQQGIISTGWDKMKQNFLVFFLMAIVLIVIDTPMQLMKDVGEEIKSLQGIVLSILGAAYWLLLLPVIEYGIDMVFLRGVRDEKPEPREMINGFKLYINIVLANLLKVGLVGIGLVMLIVPGIIVACRLAFVSYLIMDKKLSPIEAVEESWRLTKGDMGWQIFGLALISIPIFIAGLLMIGVGIIPAIMWISAFFAVAYQRALDNRQEVIDSEG